MNSSTIKKDYVLSREEQLYEDVRKTLVFMDDDNEVKQSAGFTDPDFDVNTFLTEGVSKDKKGRDTQVEIQSGATKKKRLATTPKPRPKSIGKPYTNLPLRKPQFADDLVADAVRRTNRAKKEGEG